METENNAVRDYTPVLEAQFGKVGSAEWEKSIEEAENFYADEMLRDIMKQPNFD